MGEIDSYKIPVAFVCMCAVGTNRKIKSLGKFGTELPYEQLDCHILKC